MRPRQSDLKAAGPRIPGYDLVRGLAVILMLFINFSDVFFARAPGPLDRRAAVILVMVSGAGLSLMARQSGSNLGGCRRLLRNRAFFLLAAGYLLSMVWSGDILHFYGIYILAGTCLLDTPARVLLGAGLLIWIPGLALYLDGVACFLEESDSLFLAPLGDILFTGYFPVFPWMIFFLSGMGLGRLSLTTRSWAFMLVLGVVMAASQALDWPHLTPVVPGNAATLPFSVLSGIGTGIGAVAAGHILAASGALGKNNFVVLLGRTSLTLYVGHILFIWTLNPVSEAITGNGPVLMLVVLFLALYTVFIRRWLRTYPKGPLETLMRKFAPQSGPAQGRKQADPAAEFLS